MTRSRVGLVVIVASTLLWGACGSPTSPGPTATYSPAPPDLSGHSYSLSGHVRSADTNAGLAGATVSILAGWSAGRSTTTDGAGRYSLLGMVGFYTITVWASGYVSTQRDITVVSGGQTADFTLLPSPH